MLGALTQVERFVGGEGAQCGEIGVLARPGDEIGLELERFGEDGERAVGLSGCGVEAGEVVEEASTR